MVPKFAMEDLLSAELQPGFLRLQERTCPWAEHSDDDDDDDDDDCMVNHEKQSFPCIPYTAGAWTLASTFPVSFLDL